VHNKVAREFLKIIKMDDLNDKIAVKRKQIEVENDPDKKAEYNKQLQKLLIKKQIKVLQNRIEQLR